METVNYIILHFDIFVGELRFFMNNAVGGEGRIGNIVWEILGIFKKLSGEVETLSGLFLIKVRP